MTEKNNFSDVIAPVLTPFGEDGSPDPDRFIEGLGAYDGAWTRRISRAKGRPLAYVAWFDGEAAGVGVQDVPPGHPLADLRATENIVLLETDRYPEVPLTISGPGAGWEVTASGVLSDFLGALKERYGPRRVA